jgi:putative transposase
VGQQCATCVARSVQRRDDGSTDVFDAVFQDCALQILKSPPQAPRANAICERLVGTLRREVLDQTLILNQAHLRTVLTEFQTRDNSARPHQGIGQRVPDNHPDQPTAHVIDLDTARIHRRPVLAGLTSEYQVTA